MGRSQAVTALLLALCAVNARSMGGSVMDDDHVDLADLSPGEMLPAADADDFSSLSSFLQADANASASASGSSSGSSSASSSAASSANSTAASGSASGASNSSASAGSASGNASGSGSGSASGNATGSSSASGSGGGNASSASGSGSGSASDASSSGSSGSSKKKADNATVEVDPHEKDSKDKGKAALKKMVKWTNPKHQTRFQKITTASLKDIPPPPAKHFKGTWYQGACLLVNNVTKCGTPPSGRGGHTTSRVGNKLYMFGGCYLDYGCFNDMFVLEGTNMTWTKLVTTGQVPTPRMGHTATRVGHQIMIFGGSTEDGALDDLYVFNTDTNSWIKPAVSGTAPSAREEHTAVRAGNKIFFFGGLSPDGTILGDVHVFDTEFNLWFNNPPQTGQVPSPRSGHSAVVYENRMFVFGGHSTQGSHNDVAILDTQLMSWFSPTMSGTPPEPRQDHAAAIVGYKMLVFGGCSYPDRSCFNDAFSLNVATGKWSALDSMGSNPTEREGHTMERLDQNRIVMIGGCKLDSGCYHDVHILENTTNRCARDCLKRGKCKLDDKSNSVCACAVGYAGVYCRKIVPCPNNCSSDAGVVRGVCGTTKQNVLFHACKCEPGWGGLDCAKVKTVGAGGKKSGAGSGGGSAGGSGGGSGSAGSGSAAGSGSGSTSSASGSGSSNSSASGSSNPSASSSSASASTSSSAAASSASASSASASSAASSSASSSAASSSAASSSAASSSAASSSASSESSASSATSSAAASTSILAPAQKASPQGSLQSTFRKLRGALIDPTAFEAPSDELKTALVDTAESSGSTESESDSDSSSGSGSTKKTDCPSDCSKHGRCKGTVCYCEAGFTTADCSVTVEEYEKGIDPANLIEKDLLLMFVACFVGGCAFIAVIQCGTYVYGKLKKKWRNEPDSDDDE